MRWGPPILTVAVLRAYHVHHQVSHGAVWVAYDVKDYCHWGQMVGGGVVCVAGLGLLVQPQLAAHGPSPL